MSDSVFRWRKRVAQLRLARADAPPPLFVPTVLVLLHLAVERRVTYVDSGFQLLGSGKVPMLVLGFGEYNSWFLRWLVERELPSGLSVKDYEEKTGGPFRFPFDDDYFDEDVYEIYSSNEVVENRGNPQGIYVAEFLVGSSPSLFERYVSNRLTVQLPSEAGYWRVQFPSVQERRLSVWIRALVDRKFSYRFTLNGFALCFSNTLGSLFGLPPSPDHIGYGERLSSVARGNLIKEVVRSGARRGGL